MTETKRIDPKNMGLLVASTIICLIIVEVALRMLFGFGNPVLYYQDKDVGLSMKPNQRVTRLFESVVNINSHGLRCEEFPAEKGPDEYRIFVLGGSVTYGGEYIDTGQLFTKIFERELQKKNEGEKIRVVNAGTNAHSIMNMEKKYEHKIRDLSPDVVILHLAEGNFMEPFANYEPGIVGPFWSRKPYLALQEALNYALNYLKLRIKHKVEGRGNDPKIMDDNMDSLSRLVQETKEDGVELFVVITPYRGQVYGDRPVDGRIQEKLYKILPRNRIIYLQDCFRENRAEGIYRDIVHYLPSGHKVVGRCLLETVGGRIT
jgi:hypothetical protein